MTYSLKVNTVVSTPPPFLGVSVTFIPHYAGLPTSHPVSDDTFFEKGSKSDLASLTLDTILIIWSLGPDLGTIFSPNTQCQNC